ncbi:MAG: molecular chaperone DnaJ [Planctomycetota bacterium]|nr:MAG: molecular chaperone DnaJ [Planctomycetota bacterium]REJ89005.1 MAG: molecular chaperone DnaJ [Planctomycetota bacterium]REK31246.1 MAG: molecular chaperone DnaJ [Planctomycetota bacterium]REK43615.1 MAG: molecular chaperone DnaJ [Planctomycetota bacterium]
MAGKRDYYEVLEVERTATDKTIADSYRKLAIRFHPDKNPGDDEAIGRFKEAAEAFEVLSDPQKRERYDRFGHAGLEGNGSHFADVGDIFEAFGDIFGGGGIFGDIFGGGGGRGGRRVHKGADIRCEVTIDLLEAARGVNKEVELSRHRVCEDCDGSGAEPGSELEACRYCGGRGQVVQQSGILRVQTTCPSCRGAGEMVKVPCRACRGEAYVAETVTKSVTIPAGVDDQMRVRITGEGEPSPDGGPPGDCYCFIHVTEHPLFRREGSHLICRVPLSYSQAALGATIEVPTLDGKEPMEIPAGTQPGEVFTLKRRGMPDPRGGVGGDLHVQVQIEVPKRLDREQEDLIRQLAEHDHVNVTPHRKTFTERLREFFIPDDDDDETR